MKRFMQCIHVGRWASENGIAYQAEFQGEEAHAHFTDLSLEEVRGYAIDEWYEIPVLPRAEEAEHNRA